jgi:hypothetical protein
MTDERDPSGIRAMGATEGPPAALWLHRRSRMGCQDARQLSQNSRRPTAY